MQDFQIFILSILLCLFLVQCSHHSASKKAEHQIPEHIKELDSLTVYPADPRPVYTMKLVPVQSFGGSGKPYWKVITGCAVDDSNRVIISGQKKVSQAGLYVFNPDGTYQKQVGRFGKGPGEYELASPDFQINAGRLFLQDEQTKRLSIFSTDDYAFKKTTSLQNWNVRDLKAVRNMKLSGFLARSDGNLLAIFRGIPTHSGRTGKTKFMLVNPEGNVLNPEPLMELPSPFYIVNKHRGHSMFPLRMQLPFKGRSLYALSDDDAIYTVPRTEDFLIKKYNAKGTYQSAFYYPVTGPPFDIDSVRGPAFQRAAIRNALKKGDVKRPKTAPVLHKMKIDDENRIWLTVATGRGKSEWWMLGASGKLLAKTVAPKHERICDIKNGYLYAKFFDSKGSDDPKNWVDKVVKYRIKLTKQSKMRK